MEVQSADSVNQTDLKPLGLGSGNTGRAGLERTLAANMVVGPGCGAVQTEAEKINLAGQHALENIVEKIAIGVDGYRGVP